MIRLTPRSTRNVTLIPYTTLLRSLAENFAGFMLLYHLVGGAEQVNLIRSESISLAGLYGSVSQQMMAFVYQQIERQRRAATRAMLELARIGDVSSDQMRACLLN